MTARFQQKISCFAAKAKTLTTTITTKQNNKQKNEWLFGYTHCALFETILQLKLENKEHEELYSPETNTSW